jgi:hypothetical protein
MPDGVLTPAPVNATMRRPAASIARASARLASIAARTGTAKMLAAVDGEVNALAPIYSCP